jgi:hypothetical protein
MQRSAKCQGQSSCQRVTDEYDLPITIKNRTVAIALTIALTSGAAANGTRFIIINEMDDVRRDGQRDQAPRIRSHVASFS